MNTTTATYVGNIRLPFPKAKGKSTREISTAIDTFTVERSPLPIDLAAYQVGYTEEQFAADLKKASSKLKAMAKQAVEEDDRGETLEFPV